MTKRLLDVLLGTLLALVALPVILIAAVGAAIALRTWPFFTQLRVGRDGRTFRFVKVRTLPADAPRYASKYTIQNLALPAWSRFLRRHKLDELPQLFLVPLGYMSLVGPRPEMPELHDRFDRDFGRLRTTVRPGCTGLWQIGSECHRLIAEGAEYDRFYVVNSSVRLDAWIFVRTIGMLVTSRSVTLDDVPAWALNGTSLNGGLDDVPAWALSENSSSMSVAAPSMETAVQHADA